MPVTNPPAVALEEFLGPTTRHTRRVEIYEQDGVTRWAKDTVARLKGGSVSVDYSRDERRSLDLVLDNSDEVLQNAPGEFWYDKIIKVFRGVQVREGNRLPKVLVIADNTGAPHAVAFRAALVALGFGDVRINTLAAFYPTDVSPYDIIVSLGGADSKGGMLETAYNAGKSVFVVREAALQFFNALFDGTTWAGNTMTPNATVTARNVADPRTTGWTSFSPIANNVSYKAPAVTLPNIFGIAYASTTASWTITSGENSVGGKFVAVHYPLQSGQYAAGQFRNFMLSAFNWLNPVEPVDTWEVQIGEFMIDRISEPHRPREMSITGRDYTKKCMNSKFVQSTQFAAGQTLEALIGTIAANAGITKRLLPTTGIVIGRSFFFERGKSRWDAMKEIAGAYNYEIFFDATGYLVIRPFRDPSTTPPILYFETHSGDAQVASYTKSTSDAQIFNHVVVSGENSEDTPLVWAEAINEDFTSPTSVREIGARYFEYVSAFVTTKAQAQELAEGFLSVHSLEEFELGFESLMLPWLEVGDVVGFVDPRAAADDPTIFLLSNLTLPLGLGPMSGTGRRLTLVKNYALPFDALTVWNALPDDITWNQLPRMAWNDL